MRMNRFRYWIASILVLCLTAGSPASVFAASETAVSLSGDEFGAGSGAAAKIGSDAKVASGYYVLYPSCSSARAATITGSSKKAGANLYLYKYLKRKNQVFYIRAIGNGLYTIRNMNSGRYLEAAGGGTKNKTNVRQGAASAAVNYRRWYITKKAGKYVIQSAASKKVLSVKKSRNRNKTNIYLYTYRGKKGQKWSLKPYSSTSSSSAGGRWKTSSRVWRGTAADYKILGNIIGAVESGGQVYGNQDYGAYAGAYALTGNEHTLTVGWAQHYGDEARELLKRIYKKDKAAFKKIDSALPASQRIVNYLNKDIVAMRWNPNSAQKKVIKKLLKSSAGRKAQDEYFAALMKPIVAECTSRYTDNAWAVVMYCEIRHLGGKGPAVRIFDRCGGDYSLNKIRASLKKDQSDSSSSNQVGDSMYNSRHDKCCEFLQTYMK